MTVQTNLLTEFFETTLPLIKLTKSINGKTATFIFIEPSSFDFLSYQKILYMVCISMWKLKN
jgi:hypothetical protein